MKRLVKKYIIDRLPQVTGVRFGVNPNSSSLGVDVTYLLLGGTFAIATSLFMSALIRAKALKKTET